MKKFAVALILYLYGFGLGYYAGRLDSLPEGASPEPFGQAGPTIILKEKL